MLPLLFLLALHAQTGTAAADGPRLPSLPAHAFADAAARFGVEGKIHRVDPTFAS